MACACSTVGQSPVGVEHHGAVPLMAHGHGELWVCISPLHMHMGYCRAVPPMTPLGGIVEVCPMALGHRALWGSATPLYTDMGHPAAVPLVAHG